MRGIGPPFWPPNSAAHHTGAKRLFSMVSEPAVDADPAQHHLPSFASQFMGMGFVGQRRRGAYDFGGLSFPKIPSGPDSRDEGESDHHPMRCLRSSTYLQRS
jgi:hypothetical protein